MNLRLLFSIPLLCLTLVGCGKSDGTSSESTQDSESNAVQTAMGSANSEASASEGGSLSLNAFDVRTEAVCTFGTVRTSCTSSADTIAWNGCTTDRGLATLTGGWSEAFSGTGSGSCTIPVASGGSVVRTSSGSTITLASGATIVTDTSGGTAWNGDVIPSTGTSVTNSSGTRTIVINGTHRIMKGPRGATWFEHYITSTGLTASGTRAGGNRLITGNATVYHQLAKYKAIATFNSVTWGSSTCPYPTSGSISTAFTGSITGNSTLTFTTTCGQYSYTDTSGTTTTGLTLNQAD